MNGDSCHALKLVTNIFLLFPRCFQKAFFLGQSKVINGWERVRVKQVYLPCSVGQECFHLHQSLGILILSFPGYIKDSLINPFPNNPWFLRVYSTSLLKTLWEKEKLLVMSNFSFFHSVFKPLGEHSVTFIKFKMILYKLFQFGRV